MKSDENSENFINLRKSLETAENQCYDFSHSNSKDDWTPSFADLCAPSHCYKGQIKEIEEEILWTQEILDLSSFVRDWCLL